MLDKTKEEIMSLATLPAASTIPSAPGGSECSIINLTEVAQLALQAEAEFGTAATGDVVVHIRASAVGGTNSSDWDTADYAYFNLTCSPGSRVQVTKPIWPDPKYLTVMVENQDGTYAVTNVKITRVTQDVEPT